MSSASGNILELKNVKVVYDNVILALHDVTLNVPKGKIVALLGGNGAGKSTTLKSISTHPSHANACPTVLLLGLYSVAYMSIREPLL